MEKLQAPPTVYRFDTSQSSRPSICFPKTIVDFFLPKKKKEISGDFISSLN
jgi:hypothetical protein